MCVFGHFAVLINFTQIIGRHTIFQTEPSVYILLAIRTTRKMSSRKKRFNKIKIVRALHQLIAIENDNILQLNDAHFETLAQQFDIRPNTVERVIRSFQPIVKLQDV